MDSTKDLFKKWPQASILVELAQAAGLQVEKTDRDILTLRRNDRVATVGLKFRQLSNDLVLFGTSFDGHQAQFSLGVRRGNRFSRSSTRASTHKGRMHKWGGLR